MAAPCPTDAQIDGMSGGGSISIRTPSRASRATLCISGPPAHPSPEVARAGLYRGQGQGGGYLWRANLAPGDKTAPPARGEEQRQRYLEALFRVRTLEMRFAMHRGLLTALDQQREEVREALYVSGVQDVASMARSVFGRPVARAPLRSLGWPPSLPDLQWGRRRGTTPTQPPRSAASRPE